MHLILEADHTVIKQNETVTVRLLALNDEYTPITLGHALLIGPNPVAERGPRPMPLSLDSDPTQTFQTVLQPFTFYGRERRYSGLSVGNYTFYGYLLDAPFSQLLPTGPVDPAKLVASAPPVHVTVTP